MISISSMSLPIGSGFLVLLAAAAAIGGNAVAPVASLAAPTGGRSGERVLQVHARVLWTADGKKLENAVLVVVEGRVRSVGSERDLDRDLPILHHDGTPITARFIGTAIAERLAALSIVPFRKAVS